MRIMFGGQTGEVTTVKSSSNANKFEIKWHKASGMVFHHFTIASISFAWHCLCRIKCKVNFVICVLSSQLIQYIIYTLFCLISILEPFSFAFLHLFFFMGAHFYLAVIVNLLADFPPNQKAKLNKNNNDKRIKRGKWFVCLASTAYCSKEKRNQHTNKEFILSRSFEAIGIICI